MYTYSETFKNSNGLFDTLSKIREIYACTVSVTLEQFGWVNVTITTNNKVLCESIPAFFAPLGL